MTTRVRNDRHEIASAARGNDRPHHTDGGAKQKPLAMLRPKNRIAAACFRRDKLRENDKMVRGNDKAHLTLS